MKEEKPTMSEIAKSLAISSVTVSRALSGQEGVGDELRAKILMKASELGYFKQKSISDQKILVLHQKPFVQDRSNYSFMVQGVEKALQAVGCEYSMELVDKDRQEQYYLPSRVAKGTLFDGVIFIGQFDDRYTRFLLPKIRNQVLFAGYVPSSNCDSVWFNFNNGGYKQCEYLIKHGHKKIAFIGDNRSYINKEKVVGMISALEDYGFPVRNDFFVYADEDLPKRVDELLHGDEVPTAVICQWDYTAVRLIKCLHEAGVRVPEDLSVVGSGNTEMSSLFIPALTTLELSIDYASECAVELLLKRIGRPEKPVESILIGSVLVERNSVCAIDGTS